jgi:transcriptional regulator with GAF, ATPase, and Fis domain
VAATNVNLWQKVEQGKFREDLYFRLSAFPINIPPLRERGFDIDLLFRKFTADFSERNRVRPLSLSEDARDLLLRYRFPGNIRELKNIAERMSVLETERLISDLTITQYLPSDSERSLPAVMPSAGGSSSGSSQDYSERDLLYKIFFDMRKDVVELTKNVDELKKLVMSLLKGDQQTASQIISENEALFREYPEIPDFNPERALPAPSQAPDAHTHTHSQPVQEHHPDTVDLAGFEEVTEEVAEESLSLHKQEEEMIIRALRKNNHKRKYAAQDLGISERTLYRKIKHYGLEDLK